MDLEEEKGSKGDQPLLKGGDNCIAFLILPQRLLRKHWGEEKDFAPRFLHSYSAWEERAPGLKRGKEFFSDDGAKNFILSAEGEGREEKGDLLLRGKKNNNRVSCLASPPARGESEKERKGNEKGGREKRGAARALFSRGKNYRSCP